MPAKPLSEQEIRQRAVAFVAEWRDETRERAEAQTFWNDWFAVFGVNRRRVATFEQYAQRLSTGGPGWIDVFYPRVIAAEHKSRGERLDIAEGQLLDYLAAIPQDQLPKYLVTSDFGRFSVLDLATKERTDFTLAEFPDRIELFGEISGRRSRPFTPQQAVNVKAAELMGLLYDRLELSGYGGHDLAVFLVRLVFLFFADDTGIWQRGLFQRFVEERTSEDGTDTGPQICHLFDVLNQAEDSRSPRLDAVLAAFPYINGGLFRDRIAVPDLDSQLRRQILDASGFDWSEISPAIFGSLFQSVMDTKLRRSIGAHYTTEENILKVVHPLFLDDLRAEFQAAGKSAPRLRALQTRLGKMRFLDPAAGCGNFLLIAYRELRQLETEIIVKLHSLPGEGEQQAWDVTTLSKVNVDQFYAIEIEEFPARIAETALYLVDHLENRRLSEALGLYMTRFPIRAEAHVRRDNALRFDWNDLLPASECTYILGNPPFAGRHLRTDAQTEDLKIAFGAGYHGYLDYVSGWYAKATDYMKGNDQIQAAFVSTNSITQGEQVSLLWPSILAANFEITFAHRTFRWTSEAHGKAAVFVVIIGFARVGTVKTKRLFEYKSVVSIPTERIVAAINPYLVDGSSVIVRPAARPLVAGVPRAAQGSKPTDGGHLLVEDHERPSVLADKIASKYLRPAIGAKGLLADQSRWCLWLAAADPRDLTASRVIRDRLEAVVAFRAASRNPRTNDLAKTPSLFDVNAQPSERYLCVPRHSSDDRRVIPMAFQEPEVIVLDAAIAIPGADDWLFGVLQSAMFNTWVRAVSGRIKGDPRIAPDLVYNTFPFPDRATAADRAIVAAARDVIAARDAVSECSLAQLYNPLAMPADLVHAHDRLDRAVDRSYGLNRPPTEAARLTLLLEQYDYLSAPMAASMAPQRGRGRRSGTRSDSGVAN
jgi:hypothetical protein